MKTFSQKQNKQKKILKLRKKKLPFHDALDHFVFLFFSNACQVVFTLQNKR